MDRGWLASFPLHKTPLPLDSLRLLELSENNSFHFLLLSFQSLPSSLEPFLFVLISTADMFVHHSQDNPSPLLSTWTPHTVQSLVPSLVSVGE